LAFTLVELLVVISIIGILAALLLPSLARAKRHSKMVVCLNNLRQLGLSVEYIVQDTGKYPRGLGGHEIAKEFSCGTADWARFQEMTNRPLFEYINAYSKVFSCPEDKGFDFLPEGPFFGPTLYYAFGCSYKLNKAPWENTLYVPKGFCPANPAGGSIILRFTFSFTSLPRDPCASSSSLRPYASSMQSYIRTIISIGTSTLVRPAFSTSPTTAKKRSRQFCLWMDMRRNTISAGLFEQIPNIQPRRPGTGPGMNLFQRQQPINPPRYEPTSCSTATAAFTVTLV